MLLAFTAQATEAPTMPMAPERPIAMAPAVSRCENTLMHVPPTVSWSIIICPDTTSVKGARSATSSDPTALPPTNWQGAEFMSRE